MRDTKHRALLLLPLWGACFLPDLSSKPCKDSSGCLTGYFCDTSRGTAAAIGYCTEGTLEGQGGSGVTPAVEVEVAGGDFTIGSSAGDTYTLKMTPNVSLSVSRFFMDDREVTVAAYRACVNAGYCTRPHSAEEGLSGSSPCNYDAPGRESYPVNCVEYEQAKKYCASLGRRLPTETEWEFAAVGATVAIGLKYPWGSTFDAAKACFNNIQPTCPVASKVKTKGGVEVSGSSPGFYDLAGNVWEWTDSQPCSYTSQMMPCSSQDDRVIRGGSGLDTEADVLRATVRVSRQIGNFPSSGWDRKLGFRCARTP